MKQLLLILLCGGGLSVAACGSDEGDGDEADEESEEGDGDEGEELVVDPAAEACKASDAPTYEGFAREFVMTSCLTCHSASTEGPARLMAPAGLDFDMLDEIKDEADEVYHEVVVEKAMPVGGGIEQADRDKFGVWLSCGTP